MISIFSRIVTVSASLVLISACANLTPPCPLEPQVKGILNQQQLMNDLSILASDEMAGRHTATQGGLRARNYIRARMTAIGLHPVGEDYFAPFDYDEGQRHGVNVMGWLPGKSQPQSYLIVTAHYDHLGRRGSKIYHGADDNASGVAAMLSLATYFSQQTPQHSILFVATDAEEEGLYGAKALVESPPVPLSQIRYEINLDMVSRGERSRRLYVAGTRRDPLLKALVLERSGDLGVCLQRGHEGVTGLLGAGLQTTDWTQASDHAPFIKANIPYLYFGVELHRDYHQPSDTADKVDPTFFTAAVESISDIVETLDRQAAPVKP